ncbi:MAG: EamA family transporter [Candidatus Bathyarchaeota archaeon]|nr:EamA family transporter [Candidatus Bathyarchaeota archaeon]MDH5786880.1 EamA family transporter [Candidatus Bathyarchaeota archaeon]
MKEAFGYLLIATASIIWGTMGILGKLAFGYGISPTILIALRLLISSMTILILIAMFKRALFKIQKSDALKLLILGIFATALQRITYFYAVDLTTATMAAVLFYTYPIFVTVYATLFLKEKITSSIILAIILTLSGAGLVVKAYEPSRLNANLFGIIFGILSSIFFVLYFFIIKGMRNRYTNWTLILYGDTIGAVALTPIIFSSLYEIGSYPQQLWLLIFSIAWFPSLLAYFLYSYALKHVESSRGSILSVLEPVSAAIFSATILQENFEPLQIIGVTLALTGVILLFYKPKSQNRTAQMP